MHAARSVRNFFAPIATVLVLAACGGGSSDSGPTPTPTTPTPGVATVTVSSLSFTVIEDAEVTAQLVATASDGGAVSFAKTSDPTNGTLSAFASNGAFTYRPRANFAGTDSFVVSATSARGAVSSATISIPVSAVPDSPLTVNDAIVVAPGAHVALNVLANDQDPDGETLRVEIVRANQPATAAVNADQTVNLQLPSNFTGFASFDYRAIDPTGRATPGKATIFVGVSAFHVLYSATNLPATVDELHLTDLMTTRVVTQTASTGLPLSGITQVSSDGSTVAYARTRGCCADVERQASQRLFTQTLVAESVSAEVPRPAGLEFAVFPSSPDTMQYRIYLFINHAISRDGRWLAFLARPTGSVLAGPTHLYLWDARTAGALPTRIGGSDQQFSWRPSWHPTKDELCFAASANALGGDAALYCVMPTSPTSLTRVSAAPVAGRTISNFIGLPNENRYMLSDEQFGRYTVWTTSTDQPGNEVMLAALPSTERLRGITFASTINQLQLIYASANPTVPGSDRITRVSIIGTAPTISRSYPTGLPIHSLSAASPDGRKVVLSRGARNSSDALIGSVEQFESELETSAPDVSLGVTAGGFGAFYNLSSSHLAVWRTDEITRASSAWVYTNAERTPATPLGTIAPSFMSSFGIQNGAVLVQASGPSSTFQICNLAAPNSCWNWGDLGAANQQGAVPIRAMSRRDVLPQ